MTAVPDGWEQHTPHEISGLEKRALVIGPFGSNLKTSDYRDEGVPLVFVKDIRARNFSSPRAYVSTVKAAELGVHEVQPGDILITKMGEPPGDVALYDADVPGIITADCIRLRPASGFDCRFLLHAFRTPDVRRQVNEITTGAAQQKVSLDRFRTRLHISAPPLAEQKRIAAVLDQVDILRAKRREAVTLLDDLAQSIFLDMFGDPVGIMEKWPVEELGEVLEFLTSGSRGWAKYYTDSSGLLFLRIQNVKNGELHLEDIAYVDPPATKEAIRTRVKVGDVLLSITADLGRVAVVPSGMKGAHINQHLAILRAPSYNSTFFAEFLSSPAGERQIFGKNRQAVKAGLNFDDVRSLRIPAPPRDLQDRFELRLRAVRDLRKVHTTHLAALDELFESLQQRAFAGKLWDHEAA